MHVKYLPFKTGHPLAKLEKYQVVITVQMNRVVCFQITGWYVLGTESLCTMFMYRKPQQGPMHM